ncbi:MAG: restriction endonuclease [Gemmataceae bacterium]
MRQLAERVELTSYELEPLNSGRLRYDGRLRHAAVHFSKAGWLAKFDRNKWVVTDEGKQAYFKFTDPYQFYREAERRGFVARYGCANPTPNSAPVDEEGTVDEEVVEAQITLEQAEEQAWTEVENYLRSISPYDFQDLVAALLKAMGYHIDWIAPPGRDGGIDILAFADPLGTRPPRIKVQVKRYAQNVDVNGLRSFMALLGGDDLGLFVTTGGFTKDAWAEARSQDRRRVTLVDLERFFDLWVEHYPKLDDAARRRFPLQPIYFLAPGN